MMKTLLSYLIIIALVLPSFGTWAKSDRDFDPTKSCADGKCVDRLTGLLEAKIKQANKDKCLPPANAKPEEWYQQHPIPLDCHRQIEEIESLLKKLELVKAHLEAGTDKPGCATCDKTTSPIQNLMGNLEDVDAASAELTCSPERKQEIRQKCGADTLCVVTSSALGILGPLADKIVPDKYKIKGCSSKDSCLTQFATGFAKAVVGLFESLWDGLKWAGRKIKQGSINLWNYVTGAENKSSTSQLAAAKASEDEGIFQMLRKDFGGTMGKLWEGFLAGMKEWFKTSVFCQEWSGTPQFSQCTKPAQGFDCTECKAMLTGVCSLSGTIVSEVVPAFLTGGLISAAKYGASAASKIAKVFKVSSATRKSIQASKLAKVIRPTSRVTKALRVAEDGSRLALSALKTVLVSPVVKGARVSIKAVRTVAKTTKPYIMISSSGPVIVHSTTVLKTAGKVIIFPFENALTQKAFAMGMKSTDKMFVELGARVFSRSRPVLSGTAATGMSEIDQAWSQLQLSKRLKGNHSAAEASFLAAVRQQRPVVLTEYLKQLKSGDLAVVIEDLFPELQYGKYAGKFTPADVKAAEQLLWDSIEQMPKGAIRDRLAQEYQSHVASQLKKVSVSSKASSRKDVIDQAALPPKEKAKRVIDLTGKKSVSEPALIVALEDTQKVGQGVLRSTADQLGQQQKILTQAGLSKGEAIEVINAGLAGRPRPAESFGAIRDLPLPDGAGIVDEMLQEGPYAKYLSELSGEQRSSAARALKLFEEGGLAPAEGLKTYQSFEKNFKHVRTLAGGDDDAAAMLAEFIKRQKKAGLTDDLIRKKLDEAFGACP